MARSSLASLITLIVVTACGAAPGQGSTPLAQPSPPMAALAKWKDFPAGAHPRPIIIFDRTLERIGPNGFISEPDRKRDWGCNRFVLASGITLSSAAPDSASAQGASYPGIGSARAFSELIAARAPFNSNAAECATSKPFVIRSVSWASAAFLTDRGWMTMSAWLFDISEIEAHLGYAALEPSAFWGGGVNPGGGGGARISADGLTLRITVGNAGPGKCDSDYTAATAESSTAVAFAVKRIGHVTPGEQVACTLPLRISFISAPLQAPLGGRVLVNEAGQVASVCPESAAC